MPRTQSSASRRGLSPADGIACDNVKRLFRQHGFINGNQSELARKASIDQTFVSKFLAGKTSISLTYLQRVAHALGLDSWQLLVPGDWPLSNPPVLQPLTEREKQLYQMFQEAARLAAGPK